MASLWHLQANSVFDTDKNQAYLDIYDAVLSPLRDAPLRILELGVHRAGSLHLWAAYFPNSQIFGLDLAPPEVDNNPRIKVAVADQANRQNIQAVLEAWDVDRFDIIIDDASHIGHLTAASFALLFENHLAPGGLYFIEDWGTGYWPSWPDGDAVADMTSLVDGLAHRPVYPTYNKAVGTHRIASHQAGMVGFIKLLIDIMAAPDQTAGEVKSLIAGIDLQLGVATIRKAPANPVAG